jgi:hypothetical protein
LTCLDRENEVRPLTRRGRIRAYRVERVNVGEVLGPVDLD